MVPKTRLFLYVCVIESYGSQKYPFWVLNLKRGPQRGNLQHNRSCINTITLSKDDAMTISDNVNNAGIDSVWLTSECSETQRSERLKDWSRGALGSLASTFNCGTDSS